jgi:hypothetical protein
MLHSFWLIGRQVPSISNIPAAWPRQVAAARNPPSSLLYNPAQADDWTHPCHSPDNNPQSTDRLARAPCLTQFLAEPYYAPFPEVTVASAGRIHRNTMVATPEILYLADSKSCQLIDTASGELLGRIAAPAGATGPAGNGFQTDSSTEAAVEAFLEAV